jgi:hypothetical protein
MKLKKVGSPYLHALFKAVLQVDAEEVKEILAKRIGGKLLAKYHLIETFEEVYPITKRRGAKVGDVIWFLRRPGAEDTEPWNNRIIIHEIKTGRYNLGEVVNRYCGRRYTKKALYCHVLTTNSPLFVWSWTRQESNTPVSSNMPMMIREDEKKLSFWFNDSSVIKFRETTVKDLERRGALRQLPLDWLLPILERRLGEIFSDADLES